MSGLPVTPNFTPQEFQVMFMKIGQEQQSFIQSIDITRMDGGADVETLALGYAGRVQGAAKTTINCSGIVPYGAPGNGGFSVPGMTNQGTQLDATMLTPLNGQSNIPVNFIISIGQPAAQKLVFSGYISDIKTSVQVGRQINYSFTATGSFNVFQ